MQWITLAGLVNYIEFMPVMEQKLGDIILNKAEETIYVLEHNDIYTAGTSYQSSELLNTGSISVIETGRGGKVTYHGPGQVIIYLLIDLRRAYRQRDLKLYVRNIEQVIINTLRHYAVKAYLLDKYVGIWVDMQGKPAKIAAIGIRVRQWVTYHGAAVNLTTDLTKFANIIPCGVSQFPVTSMQELGIKVNMQEFHQILRKEMNKVFFPASLNC